MFLNKVSFYVEERENHFMGSRKEWVLKAKAPDMEPWVLFVWKYDKPTTTDVLDAVTLIKRGMEFYHRHTQLPPFKLEDKLFKEGFK